MTSAIAKAFLEDAELLIEEARASLAGGHHHRVVRKAQEAAELAVKGLFRHLGIEHPKSHLLGRIIRRHIGPLGLLGEEDLNRLADHSDLLSLDREPAFYGSPEGVPASDLFDPDDAAEALDRATWIAARVRLLISGPPG